MTTLTYNEVSNFLFEDYRKNSFLSEMPRELNEVDIDNVSGGDFKDGLISWAASLGLGNASFGTGAAGAVSAGTAFAMSPLTVLGMGALAGYGGWEMGTAINDRFINPILWGE
jgi:hypothetical protein